MVHRIDQSIQAGDLHRGTSAVLLSTGFNDFGLINVFVGRPTDFRDIYYLYVNNPRIAADKIRNVAPNARIIIPGLLSVSEPIGLQRVCAVNVIPNMPGGIPLSHI